MYPLLRAALDECDRLQLAQSVAGDFTTIVELVSEQFQIPWIELFDAWAELTDERRGF